jgi:hypothetical protein
MKHEYKEGPEAQRNFEQLATALFKVPKAGGKKKAREV